MPPPSTSPLPPPLSLFAPHIHSALLLTTYASFFPSLVSTPGATLLSTLPGLTLLQTVFCLLCVTPYTPPKSAAKRKPHPTSSLSTLQTLSSHLFPTLLSLLLALPLGTTIAAFLLVVFGAPVTTHIPATLGAAGHIAVLAGLPLVVRNGVDGERWRGVVACIGEAASGGEFGGAVGAAVGAWVGAVPIPLDWDREWQKWPVTVLTGAYIGYVLGKTIGGVMPTLKVKSG